MQDFAPAYLMAASRSPASKGNRVPLIISRLPILLLSLTVISCGGGSDTPEPSGQSDAIVRTPLEGSASKAEAKLTKEFCALGAGRTLGFASLLLNKANDPREGTVKEGIEKNIERAKAFLKLLGIASSAFPETNAPRHLAGSHSQAPAS